jgi:hypothetical protein
MLHFLLFIVSIFSSLNPVQSLSNPYIRVLDDIDLLSNALETLDMAPLLFLVYVKFPQIVSLFYPFNGTYFHPTISYYDLKSCL